ncbi:MAG: gliding motility lipoprotein GldD [Flavobacteriales bacterium]|nr:gliding motility lipoprotein GldD [Flavobacteriales bacterium]
MRHRRSIVWLLLAAVLVSGCSSDPIPRPKGQLRLDLPDPGFVDWRCPQYGGEIPVYAEMRQKQAGARPGWYDLVFPGYKGTVHLTYRTVQDDLDMLIEDAYEMRGKHQAKAIRIDQERIVRDSDRVFGTFFDVHGDVAAPMIFYLTDSSTHFLYGALYFNSRPNSDSIAPVADRIRADMRHFAATLHWGASDPSDGSR